jgi:hypothetical protein
MVAGVSNHDKIIEALFHLSRGDSARFEDILWLAFGDDWTRVLEHLQRRRIVRYLTREDAYAITDHGRETLGHARAAAERRSEAQASRGPLSA